MFLYRANNGTKNEFMVKGRRLFAALAVLAVILNTLVPATHGLLSNADAGEYVEICTKNGIKLVLFDFDGSEKETTDGACNACPDCPLYSFGGLKTDLVRVDQLFEFEYQSTSYLEVASHKVTNKDPPWIRPALRAPPLSLI